MILKPLEDEEGISVGGRNVTNVRFGDETIFVAKSKAKLQKILHKGVEESEKRGVKLNCKKISAVVFSKKQVKPLQVKDEIIYLSEMLTSDGKSYQEIRR